METTDYTQIELERQRRLNHQLEFNNDKKERNHNNTIIILMIAIFVILAIYSKPNDPQYSGVSHVQRP